jgi:hypothetical protein
VDAGIFGGKTLSVFIFHARLARRIPDPVLPGAERHILLCAVQDVPTALPCDESNVRSQNIDRRIYKEIARHLRNEDGTPNTFHLKNKGITILADKVVRKEDDTYEVTFASPTQGIVDGGHTYKIITENQSRLTQSDTLFNTPLSQFVKFEILTGLDPSLATEIAGGLNKAVQVSEMTLANHAGQLDWIKEELKDEPYIKDIAFRQNDEGMYDAADILRILELFNLDLYPHNGATVPIRSYTGKENVLASHLKNPEPLQRLRPIMKDILILHDKISREAAERWTKSKQHRKGGKLAFIEGPTKNGQPFDFPFIQCTGKTRLYRGVLFSILGAFRWMVVLDPETNLSKWRGSFEDVLKIWDNMAVELLEATHQTSDELGRNPNAIGKSSNHWKSLYQAIVVYQAVTMPTLAQTA